jgi:hypothetical protein
MPSHFSTIGFPGETQEDFLALAKQTLKNGTPYPSPRGTYALWSAGEGVELWVQLSLTNKLVGLSPHYSGLSRQTVALGVRITRPDENDMEGGFQAWSNPPADDLENGDYPFVFDAPDFARHAELGLPIVQKVQLAAFAHELQAFASEEAYQAAQPEEPRFAPRSFFPMGLFNTPAEAEGEISAPAALAMFAGEVRQVAHKRNPVTGQGFYWILVDTFGGEIDVVADPEVVEGEIVPGGIVKGSFWLSGRILEG